MQLVFRSILLSLAVRTGAATAQLPESSVLPTTLRTASPAELGTLLLGPEAPAFTDSWVEGPTRRFRAITVDLATTPADSGFHGLCTVRTTSTFFTWSGNLLNERGEVKLSSGPRIDDGFVLSSDLASLKPTDASGCAKLKPVSGYPTPPRVFSVWSSLDNKPGSTNDPSVARFALAAVIEARIAAKSQRVAVERCGSGYVDVPASCGDPAAFVRAFHLRQIAGLSLTRCEGSRTICVDATIADLADESPPLLDVDHIVIETTATYPIVDAATPVVVRSITVRAGSDPVE